MVKIIGPGGQELLLKDLDGFGREDFAQVLQHGSVTSEI